MRRPHTPLRGRGLDTGTREWASAPLHCDALALDGRRACYAPFSVGLMRAGLLVTALLAPPMLCGCTSPNTYATARTLSPGDITHTVAAEGIAFHGSQGTGALPMLPTYVFRVGVVDRVDVGARIGSLTEIGADIKVNFLRGPLDLAIAGGGEAFIEWRYQPDGIRRTGSRAYFHLPLIASYNFSKTLSLVATPGLAYVIGRKVTDDFVRTQPFDGDTVAARLGIGIDYRASKRQAIHPEVTVLQSLGASQTLVLFGLGLNFGSLPSYDDVEPSTTPVAPLPPSTPPEPEPDPASRPPERERDPSSAPPEPPLSRPPEPPPSNKPPSAPSNLPID
jgi:hypothetical protein